MYKEYRYEHNVQSSNPINISCCNAQPFDMMTCKNFEILATGAGLITVIPRKHDACMDKRVYVCVAACIVRIAFIFFKNS